MLNKAMLLTSFRSQKNEMSLSFVASSNGSAINFFSSANTTTHPKTSYKVFINGEETSQDYTSLTFSANDKVDITTDLTSFPKFIAQSKNYIKSISPLPPMTENGTAVTAVQNMFQNCSGLVSVDGDLFVNNPKITNVINLFMGTKLTTVPSELFSNNTGITAVMYLFRSNTALTSIPSGLFAKNTAVTGFTGAFWGCTALNTIPEDLFENNTKVTTFQYVFNGCKNLSGRVKIGSTKVSNVGNFCTGCGAITVVVPAGSTTETTFRNYASTETNLTVETF